MNHGRLTRRERRALEEIEADLRRDRRLDRKLRTLSPGLWHRTCQAVFRPRVTVVAALVLLSLCLLVTAVLTSAPAVIWTFAGVWAVTLVVSFHILCRWTESDGRGSRGRRHPDERYLDDEDTGYGPPP